MPEPVDHIAAPAGPQTFGRTQSCDVLLHRAIELAVATAFAIPVADLRTRTRGDAHTAFARQTAMYLARVALGLSYQRAGRMFGRDRTTAAHACRVVEERRDDPFVDAQVGILEGACAKLGRLLASPGGEQ